MNYSIVTVPRVGANYLQDRILQHTEIFVERFHTLQDNKMITICRNPVDFLTSEAAMFFSYDTSTNNWDRLTIEHLRQEYLDTYAGYFTGTDDITIIDQFDMIIDYDSLINFPLETVRLIAKNMGISIINEDYGPGKLKDSVEHNYLVSSKKVKEYEIIREYVENTDLSKHYKIYNLMIAKSLKINS